MKQTIFVILASCLGICLISCNAGKLNDKAEATANNFYNKLKVNQVDSALLLCSDQAFSADPKADWERLILRNYALLGAMKSFSKTSSFNIQTSTATGTTVAVAYDVEYEYGSSKDSLTLVKEKDGSMKIYRYTWKHDPDSKYLAELSASEDQTRRYMDAVKNNDYSTASSFGSAAALKATPKDKWAVFLRNAAVKLGNVTSYQVIADSSKYFIEANGASGKGNYYDIIVKSQRGENNVYEKIVLFQKDYNEPVKIAGHYFL